ncbi:MAG TPA: phosphoglycerate dehydrogenase, partial [Burkholderiaceae bacterium]
LATGRMAAAWFDSMEPGALDPGRPLHDIDTLQITPRVAGTTRESRIRSAWAVARRIDELLSANTAPQRGEFKATAPDASLDLPADESSG